MNLIERMFALKKQECFSAQSNYDLARIAEAATEKLYTPGELISAEEETLRRVYIVAAGSVNTSSGNTVPSVFGVASVLLNMPVLTELRAGSEGACCIRLEKNLFFTIVFQYPALLHKIGSAEFSEELSIYKGRRL